jgi:anti-sigma28 factor (negative regulator of flagellin synthesis)
MQINGPKDPIYPAGGAREVRDAQQAPARQPKQGEVAPQRQTPRDSVTISDAGRKLAEQAGPSAQLSAERAAEIRKKILDGAYNSAEMAGEVAKRILASGDV